MDATAEALERLENSKRVARKFYGSVLCNSEVLRKVLRRMSLSKYPIPLVPTTYFQRFKES